VALLTDKRFLSDSKIAAIQGTRENRC
jgi:hypothetical protein